MTRLEYPSDGASGKEADVGTLRAKKVKIGGRGERTKRKIFLFKILS